MESSEPKNPVLVTGATGFIGAALVDQLIKAGRPVRVFVWSPDKAARWEKHGVEIFHGDLKDLTRVEEACVGVDVIYHGGELSTLGRHAVRHNLEIVRRLIGRALHRTRKRIVFVSSLSVAGIPSESPATEDTIPAKKLHDPYTTYKYKAEQLLRAAHLEDKLDYVIIRPALVYGPGSRHLKGLIDLLERYGKFGLPFIGAGDKIIPLAHIEDLARLLENVGHDPKASAKLIHAVDDSRITVAEFLMRIGQQLGKVLKIRPVPKILLKALAVPIDVVTDLLGFPFGIGDMVDSAGADMVFSNLRMKARLDGPLHYPTLKEGLPTLIDWYRSVKNNK